MHLPLVFETFPLNTAQSTLTIEKEKLHQAENWRQTSSLERAQKERLTFSAANVWCNGDWQATGRLQSQDDLHD